MLERHKKGLSRERFKSRFQKVLSMLSLSDFHKKKDTQPQFSHAKRLPEKAIGFKSQEINVKQDPQPDAHFYGRGKLLITGEYLVLDGAQALAVPTIWGQDLKVTMKKSYSPKLYWKSYDPSGVLWFEAEFEFWHFAICSDNKHQKEAIFLQMLLREARKLNPHFLREDQDVIAETKLEFPLSWGLGSSSTLIYNVAQWAYVTPFILQRNVLGGSGYDVACAQSPGPITYQVSKSKSRNDVSQWHQQNFRPAFSQHLWFVYLGKKVESQEQVKNYFQKNIDQEKKLQAIEAVNKITSDMLTCSNLEDFKLLMKDHEQLLSTLLGQKPIQDSLFTDLTQALNGQIKSLGAWGGDFALLACDRKYEEIEQYFITKGLDVILPYDYVVYYEDKVAATDLLPQNHSGLDHFVHKGLLH